MLGGMRKLKEYTQKATQHISGKQDAVHKDSTTKKDDENPWLLLSRPKTEKSTNFHSDVLPNSHSAPSRWLEADLSNQRTENHTQAWHDLYQKGESKKDDSDLRQDIPFPLPKQNGQLNDRTSVFFMQCMLAGALVLGGLYIHQTNLPFTKTVDGFTDRILETDYSNSIMPVVKNVFDRFHISIPTFGVHAAVYLHVPLDGKIDEDYSANHPEIWIQGTGNEPVLAAGSGIVSKVENNGMHSVVEIDHGAIGTSVYSGLGVVTVQDHEYVDSGQVIGRMPQGAKVQDLHFSLTKGGKFENPHDYIHFSAANGQ